MYPLISIGAVVFVCISFSIFCGLIWLLRCRRTRQRFKGNQTDRQMDVESAKFLHLPVSSFSMFRLLVRDLSTWFTVPWSTVLPICMQQMD
ncbi:unnamed protein product [Angiostrongylus costaricensis]|uniref:Secreted protein n=1 Tax=Angiostrongylus costaricensis TaxID=334426 RepID=A0A158PI92_ANGCS|nr:unnamed protein product [Angiostrongylus costaricensis]